MMRSRNDADVADDDFYCAADDCILHLFRWRCFILGHLFHFLRRCNCSSSSRNWLCFAKLQKYCDRKLLPLLLFSVQRASPRLQSLASRSKFKPVWSTTSSISCCISSSSLADFVKSLRKVRDSILFQNKPVSSIFFVVATVILRFLSGKSLVQAPSLYLDDIRIQGYVLLLAVSYPYGQSSFHMDDNCITSRNDSLCQLIKR
ncbi:unnamed protein product [Acanthosepion pharaonis]|uniref:Uncharacterized protein n=1 Tax=Acanthosepion pharaonis TaxID=158019 RepID=A0A812DLC7_ACAPH|nr:unnamed protein product [Sepia pharaonis]